MFCLMTQFFHRGQANLRFVFSRSPAENTYRGHHIHQKYETAHSGGVILKYQFRSLYLKGVFPSPSPYSTWALGDRLLHRGALCARINFEPF